MRWVVTISATGREDNTLASAQVIYYLEWKALTDGWCTCVKCFNISVCVCVCATGAHGRFVPLREGGVAREARTQTLEPDVWIREVQQRGHGTRRRIQLSRLELWAPSPFSPKIILSMWNVTVEHRPVWYSVKKHGVRGRYTRACSFRYSVLVKHDHTYPSSPFYSLCRGVVIIPEMMLKVLSFVVWQTGGGVGDGDENDWGHYSQGETHNNASMLCSN